MNDGTRLPVVIDTDCGVDDAVALWWALQSDALDVVGISTVWGNVGVDVATDNVLRILEATGRTDIPVAVGLAAPVAAAPDLRPADFIHGTDGLGETHRPRPSLAAGDEGAVELLRRLVDERPGQVAVVTLGPLSNLAVVLAEDPSWAARVADLTIMGGVVSSHGNALPAGEANVAHDPAAAAAVVAAGWARPPLMVGLDVTHTATLGEAEFDLLAERRTPAADFLAEPMAFYRRFGGTFVAGGHCPCHDLLAVIAAADPSLLDAPVLPLAVQDTPGPAWGATVADHRAPIFARLGGESEQPPHHVFHPWRVGLGVDVAAFRAEVRTLFGG